MGVDALRLRQTFQVRGVALARVAPDNGFHRRVGFQRCGVYANGLAFDEAALCQPLQHPSEDSLMSLGVNQPPGSRDRYVIGSVLVEPQGQEPPQRERIGQPPCDAALAVESFEETDHHYAEVQARRQ